MSTRRRYAFTLIELLVVIGILGVLAAILLPMIFKASSKAKKTRAQSDLQVISQALNHYRDDFGSYPTIDYSTAGFGDGTANSPAARSTGAAVLGRALLGPANAAYAAGGSTNVAIYASGTEYKPGDMASTGSAAAYYRVRPVEAGAQAPAGAPNYWVPFYVYDGADGPGFKSRTGGKTWGPYVDPSKVSHQGICLTDPDGGAIVYFPARTPRPNVNLDSSADATEPYVSASVPSVSLFDANDNLEFFRRISPTVETDLQAMRRMRIELGDSNANGFIDEQETSANLSFVLIAPGADGVYGPRDTVIPTGTISKEQAKDLRTAFQNSDDVTNLDIGQ